MAEALSASASAAEQQYNDIPMHVSSGRHRWQSSSLDDGSGSLFRKTANGRRRAITMSPTPSCPLKWTKQRANSLSDLFARQKNATNQLTDGDVFPVGSFHPGKNSRGPSPLLRFLRMEEAQATAAVDARSNSGDDAHNIPIPGARAQDPRIEVDPFENLLKQVESKLHLADENPVDSNSITPQQAIFIKGLERSAQKRIDRFKSLLGALSFNRGDFSVDSIEGLKDDDEWLAIRKNTCTNIFGPMFKADPDLQSILFSRACVTQLFNLVRFDAVEIKKLLPEGPKAAEE